MGIYSKLKDVWIYLAVSGILLFFIALSVTQYGPVIYYTWKYMAEAVVGIWNWIF